MKKQNNRKRYFIYNAVLMMLFMLLCGCGQENEPLYFSEEDVVSETSDGVEAAEAPEAASGKNADPKKISVYICGAVAHAGVYELEPDSRVYQVIDLAGGFAENAATDQINQAERVNDGQMIRIETQEEAQQRKEAGEVSAQEVQAESAGQTTVLSGGRVNINTAAKEELMTLPGIGASKADSIIKYREANGAFQKIEDIMQITGIKEGVFQKIRDAITI